jgi:hypothetical protein
VTLYQVIALLEIAVAVWVKFAGKLVKDIGMPTHIPAVLPNVSTFVLVVAVVNVVEYVLAP